MNFGRGALVLVLKGAMRVLPLVFAATVLASCTRTPAEPAPATTTLTAPPASARVLDPSVAGLGASAAPARCIVASPATAPPPAKPALDCPRDPLGGPPFAKMGRVSFPDGGGNSVEVELALSDDEVTRGLMYRTHMPEDHGMIFRLEERKEQTFWMHNTCIPLDMMFIDEDGTIVGILENVPTINDEARTVGCPSRYVLEVNAGWSRRHGVSAGQKAAIPRMP